MNESKRCNAYADDAIHPHRFGFSLYFFCGTNFFASF